MSDAPPEPSVEPPLLEIEGRRPDSGCLSLFYLFGGVLTALGLGAENASRLPRWGGLDASEWEAIVALAACLPVVLLWVLITRALERRCGRARLYPDRLELDFPGQIPGDIVAPRARSVLLRDVRDYAPRWGCLLLREQGQLPLLDGPVWIPTPSAEDAERARAVLASLGIQARGEPARDPSVPLPPLPPPPEASATSVLRQLPEEEPLLRIEAPFLSLNLPCLSLFVFFLVGLGLMAAAPHVDRDWLWVPPALNRDAVELLAFGVSLGAFVLPWLAVGEWLGRRRGIALLFQGRLDRTRSAAQPASSYYWGDVLDYQPRGRCLVLRQRGSLFSGVFPALAFAIPTPTPEDQRRARDVLHALGIPPRGQALPRARAACRPGQGPRGEPLLQELAVRGGVGLLLAAGEGASEEAAEGFPSLLETYLEASESLSPSRLLQLSDLDLSQSGEAEGGQRVELNAAFVLLVGGVVSCACVGEARAWLVREGSARELAPAEGAPGPLLGSGEAAVRFELAPLEGARLVVSSAALEPEVLALASGAPLEAALASLAERAPGCSLALCELIDPPL